MATATTDPHNLFLREDAETQGDVLAGFKKDHMQLLFLRFEDQQPARTWLKQLRPLIATTKQVATFNKEFSRARSYSGGDDPKNLNALWYGISLTFEGLTFLAGHSPLPGVDGNSTDGPLKAFFEGPAKRAPALGDAGQNAPQNWLFGNFGDGRVHAVLTLAADQPHALRATLGDVRQDLARAKIVTVYEQEGATLEGPAGAGSTSASRTASASRRSSTSTSPTPRTRSTRRAIPAPSSSSPASSSSGWSGSARTPCPTRSGRSTARSRWYADWPRTSPAGGPAWPRS